MDRTKLTNFIRLPECESSQSDNACLEGATVDSSSTVFADICSDAARPMGASDLTLSMD